MMRKMLQMAAIAALVVLAAFGSSGDSGTDGGSLVACTGSVSGAASGRYTCTQVTAVWAKANNQGALTINMTGSPALTIGMGFTGAPATRSYTNNDAGAVAGVSVMSGSAIWLAHVGSTGPAQGSYALKLSSVGPAVSTATGNMYSVHGTLTATLLPIAGSTAKGNATVTITF